MATQKTFREDINGLRAVAVLSVLLFHFSHNKLPGGFVGVDVFFVISGFLMTSIIFRGLENNNFSIWQFLYARARRIIPALLTVVIILLIIGYICFEPMTYQVIGKHARDSLLFVSNYTYKNESGYFDLDAYQKFLLHTWSLSVEWQFYIIYPIILVGLSKLFSIKTIKKIVFIVAVLFFIYCIYVTYKKPVSAYFMLYARAWEMMLGGLAFLYPLRRLKEHRFWLELLGLSLIGISFFIITDKTPWPGYMAGLPVIGTYLCILSNNQNSILSGYLIKKIGLWSYSIYLIHWPVIVFFKKMNLELSFKWYLAGVIFASFILYELIERKRRYKLGFLFVFILSLCLSWFVSYDGIKSRIDKINNLISKSQQWERYYGGAGIPSKGTPYYLNLRGNNMPSFLMTGDSYSRQYANFFKNKKIPTITVFNDACFVSENYFWIPDKSRQREYCEARYNNFLSIINKYKNIPLNIINSQYWMNYILKSKKNGVSIQDTKDYEILLSELDILVSRLGKFHKLFLIGRTQTIKNYSYECQAKKQLFINKIINSTCPITQEKQNIEENKILNHFSHKYENVYFIDPNDALCKHNKCQLYTDNGNPIYLHDSHLSIYGADIVGQYILNEIEKQNK